MDVAYPIALHGLFLVLTALLGLCALVGAAAAIQPSLLRRMQTWADRRYSMRRGTRSLDIPRHVDPLLYRHHRSCGAAIVGVSIFLLYVLAFGETAEWKTLFTGEYRRVGAIVVEWARLVLWFGSIFALMVGTLIFARPSALKRFERAANRWVTTRRSTYPLDREYGGVDQTLSRYPRVWGTIVACISIICMLALTVQWHMLG